MTWPLTFSLGSTASPAARRRRRSSLTRLRSVEHDAGGRTDDLA